MKFGDAMACMKAGKRMARQGWNGKGMYVYFVEGRKVPIEQWAIRDPASAPTEQEIEQGYVELLPHIDMYTVNSQGRRARLSGWLASQTDMISEDWVIIEDGPGYTQKKMTELVPDGTGSFKWKTPEDEKNEG